MKLCSNRPDGGFGPYTSGHTVRVLTTCFDDVILLPLGAWLFLAFVVVLMGVMWIRREESTNYQERKDLETLPSNTDGTRSTPAPTPLVSRVSTLWGGKWPKTRRFLLILSNLFLIALFAMHVLEIARLAANHQGIGLLPFLLVPPIVILVSFWVPAPAWAKGGWSKPARPHGVGFVVGVCVWAVWMMVTMGVKLWSLSKVKHQLGKDAYDGMVSKYPYSDKITDNVVILAVYFAILILYPHHIYLEYLRYEWRPFA